MSADELEPCDLESPICIMKSKEEKVKLEKAVERLSEGSSADESEEVEPEPPSAALRRKVSFADAFGLDLVSVKEYDIRDASGPDAREGEEYYISCLFTISDLNQDVEVKLQQQKLELERIELLPGSATIRGIIRVLNLCFHKAVYVRATLDGWQSFFELLAEYVPGSSDGETDCFSFKLELTPPLPVDGVRVEFCLRYQSAAGTYWANNGGTNYILFCHQRRRSDLKEKESEKEKVVEESKGIRSCLKTISKKLYTDVTTAETSSEISEPVTPRVRHTGENKTEEELGITSCKSLKDCCKTLVDRRRKRQAARLAHVQEYFAQKAKETQKGCDSKAVPDADPESTRFIPRLRIQSKTDLPVAHNQPGYSMDTPPILMYHQIPLLSLDWGSKTTPTPHENLPNPYNETTHRVEDHPSKSTSDAWEAFLNTTNDTHYQACDSLHSTEVSRDKVVVPLKDTISEKECNRGSAKGTETIKSDPTKLSNDQSTSLSSDLDYQLVKESGATTVPCFAPGSEPERLERESESDAQAQHHERTSGSLSQDTSEANPRDGTQSARDTETQNSESGDGISPEECTGSSDSSKVKENTHRAVKDTLTFRGIRDTNRQADGASSERKDKNKDDSGEQVEIRHFYTELHGQDKTTTDHSTETLSIYSSHKSEAFNESELCTSLNKDNSEIQESEERRYEANEGLEMKERLNETTAKGEEEEMCEETQRERVEDSREEGDEEEKEFESLKVNRDTNIASNPTVSIDPSKQFLKRETADEDFELGKTLLNSQGRQRLDVEDELPASLPSIHLSCVRGNSRLMSWWQMFNSLGHVAKTLVYVILVVVFIMSYLYDMPICLALYLFSLCWWCSQGMKQRLDGAAVNMD